MKRLRTMTTVIISMAAVISSGYAEQQSSTPALACTSDFEGGSGKIESIDQAKRIIRLTPTPHKDRGWDCWWYVKVTGIEPGETITLDFGGGRGNWAMPLRAAFSPDGRRWVQTAPGKRAGKRILYQQKVDGREAWFAWGPPLVPGDAAKLVQRVARSSPHAVQFEHCRTRGDRPVPALRVSQPGASDAERFGVWVLARQHAWECGSSWVARGLIEWLVSDDPRAEALRKRSLVTIVPIMDIDNTAIGAGGKEQKPHDHNRDWSEEPHWRSVEAAMARIKELDAAGRFDLFLDLHNPGWVIQDSFFLAVPRNLISDVGCRNLDRFLQAARVEINGPLKFNNKVDILEPKYDPLWQHMGVHWVVRHAREHVVALLLETPWNTPHSTTEGYCRVGQQLGLAIERYFRTNPRPATDVAFH